MKQIYFLCLLLVSGITTYAQQNVFSRDNSGTGDWGSGNLPWYYQTSNNNQGDPDNNSTTRNDVFIGHNNNTTMTLNGRYYLHRDFTFQAGASTARTLNNSGSGGFSYTRSLINASTATHVFNTPVGIDASGAEIRLDNGSGGSLTFNGNVFTNNNQVFARFNNNNNGTITLNGAMTQGGSFVKQGTGTLLFTGSADFSGSVFIDQGTVRFNRAMSSNSVEIGAGVQGQTGNAATLEISSNVTISKNITVRNFGTGAGTRSLNFTHGSGTATVSGTITLEKVVDLSASNAVTLSNTISGAGGINKSGSGTVTITGNNSYTGSTSVSAGSLVIQKSGFTGTITSSGVSVAFSPAPAAGTYALLAGPLTSSASFSASGLGPNQSASFNATTGVITVCNNVGLTSAVANASPICSNATTTMTASGLTGTNAVVNWWTGTGGTGTNVGTGLNSNPVGPGTYFARATGDCGSPVEIQVVVGAKTNVGLTSATATASPICSNATTTLTYSGLTGTNASVTWWSGTGGTGTSYGTGTPSSAVGPGTYYAFATGDCGSPVEIQVVVATSTFNITVTAGANGSITPGTGSVNCGSSPQYNITPDPGYIIQDVVVNGSSVGTPSSYTFTNVQSNQTISATFALAPCINNNFSGTGNWTNGALWSCGTPPNPGDNVTITTGSNVTLNTDFNVTGSFTMQTGSSMTVSPDRTFSVSGTANFNGQAVTFKSDATGYGSLGQVTGTLSGATNVTVERFLPNVGFRSWRLLSVPTSGSQTIRQSWQENNNPLANGTPGFGTLITGGGNNTGASQALGFDFSGPNTSMLSWNGIAWSNIPGTLGALSANQSYFLYVRGDRSKGVTGLVTDAGATTLRSNGSIYSGSQVIAASNTFSLIPNLYPSAINFTGLTRSGVANNYTIWDSKTQFGNQLGRYVTFSGTNGWQPNIGTVSYPANVANTTIESGQSFFVNGGAGATITLVESAKTNGSANGNLGLRPVQRAQLRASLIQRGEVLDGTVSVFDAAFSNAIDENDAHKMGNPGANMAIELAGKILSVEGRGEALEGDILQFRTWNLAAGSYELELAAGNIAATGVEAVLEDSYTKQSTPLQLNGSTKVAFSISNDAASKAANRFRVVFRKGISGVEGTPAISIAPNPVTGGMMNLKFNNQPEGRYTVRVMSLNGQVLLNRVVVHGGGSANQVLNLGSRFAAGNYRLEVISPAKVRTVQPLMFR